MSRYYLIAGEASGDLHGSAYINKLKMQDSEATFRAWGGDAMAEEGATIDKHIRDLAFMGFKEVLANLPTIFRNFEQCKKDIIAFQPDTVIFIDYPGFNLRMVKWAKRAGFHTIYYISPQLWAWKPGRYKTIRDFVDKMIVILPFEKAWYAERGVEVEYQEHPLLERIDAFQHNPNWLRYNQLNEEQPIVALLPGSRKQELAIMLPIMLEAATQHPHAHYLVAQAPAADDSWYLMIKKYPQLNIKLIRNDTYNLLSYASAALVTSGTATLETALFGVPQVVCYKGSWLSYQIGSRLVKVDYISLVNLILDEVVVPELIQDELTVPRLRGELANLLEGDAQEDVRKRLLEVLTV